MFKYLKVCFLRYITIWYDKQFDNPLNYDDKARGNSSVKCAGGCGNWKNGGEKHNVNVSFHV